MLTRPAIADDDIKSVLAQDYGLQLRAFDFLPLGNDMNSYVYRAETLNDGARFIKVKLKIDNPASLIVPRYLRDLGIAEVVAPMESRSGQTYVTTEGFSVIVYPYVAGGNGMDTPMTDVHWIAYGNVLRRIHDATVTRPPEVDALLRREAFDLPTAPYVSAVQARMHTSAPRDDIDASAHSFWRVRDSEINALLARTEQLGELLRKQHLPPVLCHSDIHTANLMVQSTDIVCVVDWDGPMLAPRERDLMFVAGMSGVPGDWITATHESLFFQGYGAVALNWPLLAYYRYERALEDMSSYGDCILSESFDEATRRDALKGLMQVFAHGEAVEWARACDARSSGDA